MGRTWNSRKDESFKSKPKTLKPGRRTRPEDAEDYDWRKDDSLSETDEKAKDDAFMDSVMATEETDEKITPEADDLP